MQVLTKSTILFYCFYREVTMIKNLNYIHAFCIIVALGFSVKVVLAQEKPTSQLIESWECFDDWAYNSWAISKKISKDINKPPVLARLKRFSKGGSEHGEVVVAGSLQKARFQIRGFNRRWDFGARYKYTFIIEPNKSGAYYDFTTASKVMPSQLYKCEK